MGQQIGFYAIKQDHLSVLALMDELGLLAIPELKPTNRSITGVSPRDFQLEGEQTFFYLLPGELAPAEAFYSELDTTPSTSKLLPLSSPVIEFTPCCLKDSQLFDGRIHFGTSSDDPRFTFPARAYEKLASYIRQWRRTNRFGFYVGPETASLSRSAQIRLMHHRIELHVE